MTVGYWGSLRWCGAETKFHKNPPNDSNFIKEYRKAVHIHGYNKELGLKLKEI
jgi:hypothetical protein